MSLYWYWIQSSMGNFINTNPVRISLAPASRFKQKTRRTPATYQHNKYGINAVLPAVTPTPFTLKVISILPKITTTTTNYQPNTGKVCQSHTRTRTPQLLKKYRLATTHEPQLPDTNYTSRIPYNPNGNHASYNQPTAKTHGTATTRSTTFRNGQTVSALLPAVTSGLPKKRA